MTIDFSKTATMTASQHQELCDKLSYYFYRTTTNWKELFSDFIGSSELTEREHYAVPISILIRILAQLEYHMSQFEYDKKSDMRVKNLILQILSAAAQPQT